MSEQHLKVYFVLGEESGDALGADLLPALHAKAKESGKSLEVVGLAGSRLSKAGVKSLFDIEEIAVMGFSAVIGRLPTIIRRVYQTVSDIVAAKPDIVVLIDSPDFTHAVAKRLRKKMPNVPVVNYVCPSVWAWRPGRAKKMKAYVDHVLTILPFEPLALEKLQGPKATYVGHPLARQIAALPVQPEQSNEDEPILLILPGSRHSELKRMLSLYGQTLEVLKQRGVQFKPVLPAVPKLKQALIEQTSNWSVRPEIVDSADNDQTFASASAALATSGTVALQLALHKVPMVSAYRLDPIARPLGFLVKSWSTLLPNLIADRVVVPEEVNESVMPERLARHLERLLQDTHERKSQLEGFADVVEAMETPIPPGERAAEIILSLAK